nr:MAG TPA: Major capsid protein [Caudoviricetes sp.]
MANSIQTFKKYIDLLDEVYKNASKTSMLDGDNSLVKAGSNTHEIVIPKISMDGLGDYSRNGGYVDGDVTLTNETVAFNYDRGRAFTVDAMDNEETAGVAFGKLASEFIRTKVVPEMDAFRFAQYAGTTGISKVSAGATLSTGENVISALRAGVTKMDEDEVPSEDRYLFITPTLYGLIRDMDTTKSKDVLTGFAQVILVPQTRFYTAITLYDGKTDTSSQDSGVNQKPGGYVKATAGKDINFMIIHKPALMQYTKHTVSKIITPEENQTADAYKFPYRAYGLADVYENKTAGIYLHHKA